MAYSDYKLSFLVKLVQNGIFSIPSGGEILELGTQVMNLDSKNDIIFDFIKYFNKSFNRQNEFLLDMPVEPWIFCYMSQIYIECGFHYYALDIVQYPHSIIFDLNNDSLPVEFKNRFDIVTNFGTSEHVCNQLNVFRVIHESLKVGGYVIHEVPFTGFLNHGLFNYHPKFFLSLIRNNRYRLCFFSYSQPHSHEMFGKDNKIFEGDFIRFCEKIDGSKHWENQMLITGGIFLIVKKCVDQPFVVPTDFPMGYYNDEWEPRVENYLNRDIPVSEPAWANAYLNGLMKDDTNYVQYIGEDCSTKGKWIGQYGKLGSWIGFFAE